MRYPSKKVGYLAGTSPLYFLSSSDKSDMKITISTTTYPIIIALLFLGSTTLHFGELHAEQLELPTHAFELLSYDSRPESIKLMQEQQQRLEQFVDQNGVEAILKDPQGANFLAKYSNLTNFLTIHDIFDDCVDDEQKDKNIHLRLLDSAARQRYTTIKCDGINARFKGIKDFAKLIMGKTRFIDDQVLANKLNQLSTVNTLKTYAHFLYQFEGKESLSTQERTELCPSCTPTQQIDLIKKLQHRLQALRDSRPPQYTTQEITSQINQKIEQLNHALDNVNDYIYEDPGRINLGFWDSSDPILDESQTAYKQYTTLFAQEASSGPGLLLNTDVMRDHAGTLRQQDNLDEHSLLGHETTYSYPPHKKIDQIHVRQGIKEAKGRMRRQLEALAKMELDQKERAQQNIKRLITSNPAAAGELLINSPEYAWQMCESVNSLGEDMDDEKFWDKTFFWGGMVVGGGLMLTGVGSGVAAWLIGGSATAGALGTAAVVSAVGGLALGVADTSYYGNKAYQNYLTEERFKNSMLAGTGDPRLVEDIEDELEKFKSNVTIASMALAFSALDLAALKNAIHVVHLSRKVSVGGVSAAKGLARKKELSRINQVFEEIWANPTLTRVMKRIKRSLGGERFASLLHSISMLSDKMRVSILTKIAKLRGESPLVNQALADAINQGIKKGNLNTTRAKEMMTKFKSEGIASLHFNSSGKAVLDIPEAAFAGTPHYYTMMAAREQVQRGKDFRLITTKGMHALEREAKERMMVFNINHYPVRYYDDQTHAIATHFARKPSAAKVAAKAVGGAKKADPALKAQQKVSKWIAEFKKFAKPADALYKEGLSYQVAARKLRHQARRVTGFPTNIEVRYLQDGAEQTRRFHVTSNKELSTLAREFDHKAKGILGGALSQGKLGKHYERQALLEARLRVVNGELKDQAANLGERFDPVLKAQMDELTTMLAKDSPHLAPQRYRIQLAHQEFKDEAKAFVQGVRNYEGKEFIEKLSTAEKHLGGYLDPGMVKLKRIIALGGTGTVLTTGGSTVGYFVQLMRSNLNTTYDLVHMPVPSEGKPDGDFDKALRKLIKKKYGRKFLRVYLTGNQDILKEEDQAGRRFAAHLRSMLKMREQHRQEIYREKKFDQMIDQFAQDELDRAKQPGHLRRSNSEKRDRSKGPQGFYPL
jgi:hypothetical protein